MDFPYFFTQIVLLLPHYLTSSSWKLYLLLSFLKHNLSDLLLFWLMAFSFIPWLFFLCPSLKILAFQSAFNLIMILYTLSSYQQHYQHYNGWLLKAYLLLQPLLNSRATLYSRPSLWNSNKSNRIYYFLTISVLNVEPAIARKPVSYL